MRIYISGKITGLNAEVSQQYFQQVEDLLTNAGHIALNPWKILPFHPDLTWHDYMAEDAKAIIHCDAIIMLENWRESKGAKVEHSLAESLGLKMFYMKNHDLF